MKPIKEIKTYRIKGLGLQTCLRLCVKDDIIIDKAGDSSIVTYKEDDYISLSELKLDGSINKRLCSREYVKSQLDGWWYYSKGMRSE
tara:strand:+ start:1056 stop:1316 length:261 start_codon:yes stop_codon:yes gene_type:complete